MQIFKKIAIAVFGVFKMQYFYYILKDVKYKLKKYSNNIVNYYNGKKIIKSLNTPTDLRRFQEIILKNYGINKNLNFDKIADVTKDCKKENTILVTKSLATIVPLGALYLSNDYLNTNFVYDMVAGLCGVFSGCMAMFLYSNVNSFVETRKEFREVCCDIGRDLNKEQALKMADLVKHCAYVEHLEKEKAKEKTTTTQQEELQK